MASELERLIVKLEGDIQGFKSELDKAEGLTKRTARTMEQRFLAAGRRMRSVGIGLTAGLTVPIVAAGTAAVASAVKLGNYADSILDLEQITGLTTTTLQEFENVARIAGVSTSVFSGAAQGLQRRLRGAGEESKTFTDNIEALGVNTRDANGQLRSVDDLLPEIITKLQGIENATERNSISMQVLGRSAGTLAPVLGLTADQFAAARQEAHDMGQVLDRDALNAANNFRIEWEQLRAELGFAGREIQQALIPAVTGLAESFRSDVVPVIKAVAERTAEVIDWWNSLDDASKRVVAGVTGVGLAAGPVLTVFGQLVISAPKVAAGLRAITLAAGPLLGPVGVLAATAAGAYALGEAFTTNKDRVNDLIAEYDRYRGALVVTSAAERDAALESLTTQRQAIQERLALLKELAESQKQSTQGFIDSTLGRFLLPGFIDFEGGASEQTLADIAAAEEALSRVTEDARTLASRQFPPATPTPDAPGGTTPGAGTDAPSGTESDPISVRDKTREDILAEQVRLAPTAFSDAIRGLDAARTQSALDRGLDVATGQTAREALQDNPDLIAIREPGTPGITLLPVQDVPFDPVAAEELQPAGIDPRDSIRRARERAREDRIARDRITPTATQIEQAREFQESRQIGALAPESVSLTSGLIDHLDEWNAIAHEATITAREAASAEAELSAERREFFSEWRRRVYEDATGAGAVSDIMRGVGLDPQPEPFVDSFTRGEREARAGAAAVLGPSFTPALQNVLEQVLEEEAAERLRIEEQLNSMLASGISTLASGFEGNIEAFESQVERGLTDIAGLIGEDLLGGIGGVLFEGFVGLFASLSRSLTTADPKSFLGGVFYDPAIHDDNEGEVRRRDPGLFGDGLERPAPQIALDVGRASGTPGVSTQLIDAGALIESGAIRFDTAVTRFDDAVRNIRANRALAS